MLRENEKQARLDDAIALMQRVIDNKYEFDMQAWAHFLPEEQEHLNEHDAHVCGTAACFAGWLGLSPEFQKRGGGLDDCGTPIYEIFTGSKAISKYFSWSLYFSRMITATHRESSYFYTVDHIIFITPEMVLDKLHQIKRGEINPNASCLEDI